MAKQLAIHLQDLTKDLGKFQFGPFNLEVEEGSVVALVGPNGSGKSTLFRLMTNIVHPTGGTVHLTGAAGINGPGCSLDIGYVPETSYWDSMPFKTVGQLTHFVSHWYSSWNVKWYRNLMETFELDEAMKLDVLSKGMKRKLDFIHAIAFEPKLLLLDEPTSGLDPISSKKMMDILVKFMEKGNRSIFFSTHYLEEVRRMADYVTVIHKGQSLGTFEKDTLLDQWKVFWVDRIPNQPLPGVVSIVTEQPFGGLIKIISNDAFGLEHALGKEGIYPVRIQAVELDEILLFLINENKEKTPSA